MPRRTRQRRIPRDERSIERFSQRNVSGIVGSQIRPELPDSGQEHRVWVTDEGKAGKVLKSGLAAGGVKFFGSAVSADALRYLDIQEVRSVQRLPIRKYPGTDPPRRWS